MKCDKTGRKDLEALVGWPGVCDVAPAKDPDPTNRSPGCSHYPAIITVGTVLYISAD